LVTVWVEDHGSGLVVTDYVDATLAIGGKMTRNAESGEELVMAAGDGKSMDAAIGWVGDPDSMLRVNGDTGGCPRIRETFG
jgi:hypothetical protein